MQHSPYEIKERLLGALDKDYNVVDMASVIQVITLLEKTQITKDALEKTRLGKFVNELRKRTTNEMLARRAKELVKNWRRLLEPPSENIMVNGERISPPGPGPGQTPSVANNSRSSGALMRLKSSNEGHQSTPISRYKQVVRTSPDLQSVRTASPLCFSASSSPIASMNYAPVKCEDKPYSSPSQRQGNGKQHSSPNVSPNNNNNSKPISPSVRRQGNKAAFHSTVDLAKTNVANKRLRKDDTNCVYPKNVTTPPVNSVYTLNGLDNGDRTIKVEDSHSDKRGSEKHTNALLMPSSRLQKVKTTQQLIDELQNKKGSAVPQGSLSITLPPTTSETRTESLASLKKTGRKNLALEAEMSKTKSELMDRFLKSSASSEIPDMNESQPSMVESVPVKEINEELKQIFCTLPPLDLDAINWDQEVYVPTNVEVTEDTVQHYCEDQWEHVNGTYDHEHNWQGWEEVTSSETLGSEVLRILPYVNTDW